MDKVKYAIVLIGALAVLCWGACAAPADEQSVAAFEAAAFANPEAVDEHLPPGRGLAPVESEGDSETLGTAEQYRYGGSRWGGGRGWGGRGGGRRGWGGGGHRYGGGDRYYG